jgi:penicillin-binding protein 1A
MAEITERAATPPRGRRKRVWPYAVVLVLAWGAIFGGIFFSRFLSVLPDVGSLLSNGPSHDITILDDHERLIARRGLTQGVRVEVSTLPSYVPNAFIAVEDRRFHEHIGLDPIGLMRAAYENMMVGRVVQGGSTLTQQLAKNLFLEPNRTYDRKLQEAMLALYLEYRYSKDQILTLYLNRVYFGAGVYGIEAAAERFFGKRSSICRKRRCWRDRSRRRRGSTRLPTRMPATRARKSSFAPCRNRVSSARPRGSTRSPHACASCGERRRPAPAISRTG